MTLERERGVKQASHIYAELKRPERKCYDNQDYKQQVYPLFGDFHMKNWTKMGKTMPTKAQTAVIIPTVVAKFAILLSGSEDHMIAHN